MCPISHSKRSTRPLVQRERSAPRREAPPTARPAEEEQLAALLREGIGPPLRQITPALAGQIGNRALGRWAAAAQRVQRQPSPEEEERPEASEPSTAPLEEGTPSAQAASARVPSSDAEEFVPDQGAMAASWAAMERFSGPRNAVGPPKPGQAGVSGQLVPQAPFKPPRKEGGAQPDVGAASASTAAPVAGTEAGAPTESVTPEAAGAEAPAIEPPEGAADTARPAGALQERKAAGGGEGEPPERAEAAGETPEAAGVASAGASRGRAVSQQATAQMASQVETADSEQAGREASQAREAGEEVRAEAQAEETARGPSGRSAGQEALAPPERGAGEAARERAERLAARVRSLVQRGSQILAQGARSVASFLRGMVARPAGAVAGAMGAIAEFARRTASQVGRAIRSAAGTVMRIISTVASATLGTLQRAYSTVRDVMGRLIAGAARFIEAARDRARAFARRMYQGAVRLVRQARVAATTGVRAAVQGLVRVVGAAGNAARSGIRMLGTRVRQGIASARQRVRDFLDTALGGESPLAPRFAARVRQRLRQIARQRLVRLPEIMSRVRLATVAPLLAVLGSAGNAVRTIWNGVRETFREVFAEPARVVQEHVPEIAAEVQLAAGDGETLAAELEAAAQEELSVTEAALLEVEGELRAEAEMTGETL